MKGNKSYINFGVIDNSDVTLVNCKALWVGSTGDLVLSEAATGAGTVTFKNVPNGTLLEFELKNGRVMAATTASNINYLRW